MIWIMKKKRKTPRNITSKGSLQYQYAGFILITSDKNIFLVQVNYIFFCQTSIKGQETKTHQLYVVPIGNSKITEKIEFRPEATVLNITKNYLIVVV